MTSKLDVASWNKVQDHEQAYWGNCLNGTTWIEFVKQEVYGREMRLFSDYGHVSEGELNMGGLSVLDVGGGPVSMCLRCFNNGRLTVADPGLWPVAAMRRYQRHGIEYIQCPGEELDQLLDPSFTYDEIWIYNVLQHVRDPEAILSGVRQFGKLLRIFEWLDIPTDAKHPHCLTEKDMRTWLHGLNEQHCRVIRLDEPNRVIKGKIFCGVYRIGGGPTP